MPPPVVAPRNPIERDGDSRPEGHNGLSLVSLADLDLLVLPGRPKVERYGPSDLGDADRTRALAAISDLIEAGSAELSDAMSPIRKAMLEIEEGDDSTEEQRRDASAVLSGLDQRYAEVCLTQLRSGGETAARALNGLSGMMLNDPSDTRIKAIGEALGRLSLAEAEPVIVAGLRSSNARIRNLAESWITSRSEEDIQHCIGTIRSLPPPVRFQDVF